ncbi:hypothetical protein HMPREF0542_11882 [Ligilactobacillus ruminis ATCC 25644]|uniref:Uncharacterized protein n=1 Tax=Ligilactobacillus ruminis ATCC 25644 TaxID=525362 RepID=E7FSK5_9LACO|nr:hypothetical protein HMPREF0542_11882 [Ligilactobacillus ruminis ATCC 25644]
MSVNLDEILSELVEQYCILKRFFSCAKIKEMPYEFSRKSIALYRPLFLQIKNGRGKTRPFVILVQAL